MILDIRAPDYRRNPYPAFRRLRAEAPVCRIAPHGHWVVARHADVQTVLRNPKLFSSAGIGDPPPTGPRFLLQTRGLIGVDPPEHRRLRNLVGKAFAPAAVRALEPRIRGLARGLIEPLVGRPTFDLVSGFSAPLPILVLSDLLGIDADRREDFKRWTHLLLTWRNVPHEVDAEVGRMYDYFTGVIAARQAEPRADLISTLLAARDGDERLTATEVLSFVRILLVAGTEASTNLVGNAVLAAQANGLDWRALRGRPERTQRFLEEALRYDGPVIALLRRATADCAVAGVRIAQGELVLPLLASANHDEAVFAHPETFDLGRDAGAHMTFGGSVHFCLGASLARLQARVAFEELFAAFAGLTRADDEPLDYLDSFFFRGVRRLIVAPA